MKKFDNYKQNIYNTRISVTPQASLYSSLVNSQCEWRDLIEGLLKIDSSPKSRYFVGRLGVVISNLPK